MSGLTIFLLVMFGLVGIFMFISNPFMRLGKLMAGKTSTQLEEEGKAWVDKVGPGEACRKGCSLILFYLVAAFYSYIIEPLVVILAIIHKVGNPYVAYAMGGIILISWLESIGRAMVKQLRGKKELGADEVVIKSFGGPVLWLKRLFYFLPTLYLWYLASVGLGILP